MHHGGRVLGCMHTDNKTLSIPKRYCTIYTWARLYRNHTSVSKTNYFEIFLELICTKTDF